MPCCCSAVSGCSYDNARGNPEKRNCAQIVLGLLTGICFGFLLQKGGATDYGVIENQLLLTDFTVMKLMLSAVIVGMILFQILKHYGYANLHAAHGTIGSNVIGGLHLRCRVCPARLLPGNGCRCCRDGGARCTHRGDGRDAHRCRYLR